MNQDMMAKLARMQEQLAKSQEEIESRVATGTAGGGAVSVEITGAYHVNALKIDPEVVDPGDVAMLEDLVLAAVRDAVARATELSEKAMGTVDLGPLGGGLLG